VRIERLKVRESEWETEKEIEEGIEGWIWWICEVRGIAMERGISRIIERGTMGETEVRTERGIERWMEREIDGEGDTEVLTKDS
jgi:hypothetical protein